MKFWLHSEYGDLHFLAHRLRADGHEVQLYIHDQHAQPVGAGLLPRPKAVAPPADATIVFDTAGHGALGRAYRPRHGVIGGNEIDKALEVDRVKATEIFKQYKLKVPETHAFRTIAQGRAFLLTHEGKWYWKPNGNLSTSTTYNGKDAESLSRFLGWAEQHVMGLTGFEFQRAVRGTEVSTEGWFDGRRFVPPFNSTFEDKRLLVGDKGPRTGCQVNVVWAYGADLPPLVKETVDKLEPLLLQTGYVGPIDLNAIVTDEGEVVVLEASPRTGFDALQALSLLVEGDWGEQLTRFAKGRLDAFDVRTDAMAMTLRLTVPPYPTEDKGAARKQADLPLDERIVENPRRYLVDDVCRGPDGKPALAGRDGNVMCLGVTGTKLGEMRQLLLNMADALDIPNAQYRTDPILRAEKDFATLHRLGYLEARDVPVTSQRKADDKRERRYGMSKEAGTQPGHSKPISPKLKAVVDELTT